MTSSDTLIPFVFDRIPVRGALVQLDASWQRIQNAQDYTPLQAEVLGHAAAASVLIAHSLKLKGHVTLQMSGDGPLSMLAMQCSSALALRGILHADDEVAGNCYEELVAGATCAITVDGPDIERPYQGIVEASGQNLAESLVHYYDRSVQVPSHLALLAEPAVAGGLLLQQMPSAEAIDEDDWRRLGMMAATLQARDIESGIDHSLLTRLFPEDDIRVFESRQAEFRCPCSRERSEEVLRMLGQDEAQAALSDTGKVDITCEYCGRRRQFDAVDIERLFAAAAPPTSDRLH